MTWHGSSGRVRRSGYTLIELLVVMAIIALLVGLLMSAVMSVLTVRDRRANQHELMLLEKSMKVAYKEYNDSKTLPGYLVLYNNLDVYRNPGSYLITNATTPSIAEVKRSADVLRRMFGKRLLASGTYVSWDGTTVPPTTPPPNPPVPNATLRGEECLVFYLGGMGVATTSGGNTFVDMQGFSTNPVNPMEPKTVNPERIGPFYEFRSNRLVLGAATAPTPFYFVYKDTYGTPYVYFGGSGSANSYASSAFNTVNSTGLTALGLTGPYYESASSPAKFLNPNSFQIISAGKNGRFGVGGAWDQLSGDGSADGRDDQANFSARMLGFQQE